MSASPRPQTPKCAPPVSRFPLARRLDCRLHQRHHAPTRSRPRGRRRPSGPLLPGRRRPSRISATTCLITADERSDSIILFLQKTTELSQGADVLVRCISNWCQDVKLQRQVCVCNSSHSATKRRRRLMVKMFASRNCTRTFVLMVWTHLCLLSP
jgi:hypothetical protein